MRRAQLLETVKTKINCIGDVGLLWFIFFSFSNRKSSVFIFSYSRAQPFTICHSRR